MIVIKPHHFIDIITSFGAGEKRFEPHPLGHAVHVVAEKLLVDRGSGLRMELGIDDICRTCRKNVGGICVDTIDTSYRPEAPELLRQWNLLIDERWEKLKWGVRFYLGG